MLSIRSLRGQVLQFKMEWHSKWLANMVLIPKPNGTMLMCMDMTDLNKICIKDSFPLPLID